MNPAELLPQVYHELRKVAAAKLASEKPGHTLDATVLIHPHYATAQKRATNRATKASGCRIR